MTTHHSGYLVAGSGFKVGNQESAYSILANGNAGTYPVITVGAESTSVINVAVQYNTLDGVAATGAVSSHIYFTTDAPGQTVAAVAAAIGTDGTIIATTEASVASYVCVSEADGDLDIDVTKAGAYTAYAQIVNPDGTLTTGPVMTFGA